jgi:GNAT superfamily N-acetyltransferase
VIAMPDMLVKLYDLPSAPPADKLAAEGIDIRRAMAPDKVAVVDWVRAHFGDNWAGECDVAFSRQPVSCFVAVQDYQVIGFACHEATCLDFFGPTGVDETYRGRGIGTHLLFACLMDMRARGYAYAVIGGAGPVDFYAKTVGAVPIEGSVPGIYGEMLSHGE